MCEFAASKFARNVWIFNFKKLQKYFSNDSIIEISIKLLRRPIVREYSHLYVNKWYIISTTYIIYFCSYYDYEVSLTSLYYTKYRESKFEVVNSSTKDGKWPREGVRYDLHESFFGEFSILA